MWSLRPGCSGAAGAPTLLGYCTRQEDLGSVRPYALLVCGQRESIPCVERELASSTWGGWVSNLRPDNGESHHVFSCFFFLIIDLFPR